MGRGRQLETVEAARGIAALAVVLFHANGLSRSLGGTFLPMLSLGQHGVDFFFVLSGFIIYYVHHSDIGAPARAKTYAIKRFIRLYPLIWLIVIPWIAVKAIKGEPVTPDVTLDSLLLLPSTVRPIPVVLWTLRHEVLFYAVFTILIWRRGIGLSVLALWTTGCLAQVALVSVGHPLTGVPAMIFSSFELEFMAGVAVAYAYRRWGARASALPLIIGLALFALVFTVRQQFGLHRLNLLDYTSVGAAYGTMLLGLAFSVILYGLLAIEGIVRVPVALSGLGAASYALYLVHTAVNAALQNIFGENFPLAIILPLAVGAGVIVAILLHRFIEAPMTKALRNALLSPTGKASRAA